MPVYSVQADSMLPQYHEGRAWDDVLDRNDINLQKSNAGDGIAQLQDLVLNSGASIVRYLLVSVAIFYIIYSIIKIIFNSGDESKVGEYKETILNVIVGLLIVSLAGELASIFDPVNSGGVVGNFMKFKSVTQMVINYLALITGGIAVFFILLAAFRMITSGGDEATIDQEKTVLSNAFIALLIIIMSDVMINKIFYPSDLQAPGAEEVQSFASEAFGIIKYFLEYASILNIALIILAGGYYIFSYGDEERENDAKSIISRFAYIFITIIFAYTIVSFIVPS